jgi:transposase InsO family protein
MQNEQWIADRALLQRSLHDHPEWTQPQLAAALGRSLGFVKKWVKRIRCAPPGDMSVLFGLPRRRKTPYPQSDPQVEERILAIRDEPPEHLKRVPGPKAILYYLPRDPALQARTAPLPRSTRTIWKILTRNGRIAHPARHVHQPLERPAPMSCWQIDFKDASTVPADPYGKQQHVVEILNVVDMGTSIVVAAHVHANFQAQTALEAMAEVLTEHGRPEAITFDRDPRWVGSASGRDFPSAFLRFLLCLGIEPNVCPPQRPDLNAFVERYHRTLKQECLLVHDPRSEEQVREANASFVQHYNQERPNQALACGNQPPRVAFADLPSLPHVPEVVDPDAWMPHVDGQHCIRKIRQNGSIVLDDVSYDVKQRLAGHSIDVSIDASQQELVIWHQHQPIKRLPIKGLHHTPMRFEPFVSEMAEQARSQQRRLHRARWSAQLGSESA